ncbi:hypothetical protein [Streptomyces sp. AM8-1-1]|uniref:hypothetical protein n=1 Tax=Streptomyces sp. AM8-1-1 TaxID=3075825 RepID=UPI0028C4B3B5|nr:hypothetical protein [Streptomyces sp. AM8-1-1]WNO76943.1 hypothetical protein RPQ07_37395 [Streptomyces sp. AM8-1-1]
MNATWHQGGTEDPGEDEEALPELVEHRGIIGDRHLVAVQTFDIARLTTHAVPVVPETFVAVSGMGPKDDSNGSGKTSFLIAVSLLLADPQWRLESNHGLYASGILFKPDAAGVDQAQQIPAASHGYVVGVFARDRLDAYNGDEGDDPGEGALTVWVRIAASAPYVQANWAEGIHVADAATDVERAVQADDLWQELGSAGRLSAHRMADVLYGNAPRCLTYLDTPLRPAVPSLLSQQMTAMEPHDIGEALIALSGMSHLLEQEGARRGKALEHAAQLEKARNEHGLALADEEAVLEGVRARAAARAALEAGGRAWRRYVAACYLRAVQADWELAADLEGKELQVVQAQTLVDRAEEKLHELKAATGLAEDAAAARQEWVDAKQVTEEAAAKRTSAATRRDIVRQNMAPLRPSAGLWRGAPVADARSVLEVARNTLYTARQQKADAERSLSQARQLEEAARQGRSGAAGQALEKLDGHGISAVGLMDQLQLEESARAEWEARLWPWRDAVVVPCGEAERARELLRDLPGAQVIAADPADETGSVGGVLPPGVHSGRALAGFLGALQERMTALEEPTAAYDARLSLAVVGGFLSPIAGRDARVAQAVSHRRRCEDDVSTATAVLSTAESEFEVAEIEHDAAVAARDLAALEKQASSLKDEIAEADAEVATARGAEERLHDVWERAQSALAAHDQTVTTAKLTRDAAAKACKEQVKEHTALVRARSEIACPQWQQLWGASVEEAAEIVEVTDPGTPVPRPGRLRREVEDRLRDAYEHYGLPAGAVAAVDEDLRLAQRLRAGFAEEEASALPRTGFDEVAAPLQIRLDGHADKDAVEAARIDSGRSLREQALAKLTTAAERSEHTLQTLQDMIEHHVEGLFAQISDAFDALDRQRGGDGARLEYASVRAEGAKPWRWKVTPRWKRSPRGAYVHYRENANGAQVKVHAIQLVLAAVLADAETRGRVLILDELGNSLGEVNRKDMLAALRDVARRQHLTILGTCQDSVLVDAADVCDELLWFVHASSSDAYNQPTRAWGHDTDAQRVELTADWITAGRSHA